MIMVSAPERLHVGEKFSQLKGIITSLEYQG